MDLSLQREDRSVKSAAMRLCTMFFIGSWTSQDKTLNAESFDRESGTSRRISGCLSDVAKKSRIHHLRSQNYFRQLYSYRNALDLYCHFYVVEATYVCIFKTKIMQFQRAPKRCIKRFRPLITDLENKSNRTKRWKKEYASRTQFSC